MFKKPSFKALVLDLDNTVVLIPDRIHPRVKAAILAAQKAGIKIFFATGRSTYDAWHLIEKLELNRSDVWLISLNGAFSFNFLTKKIKKTKLMTIAEKKICIKVADETGVVPVYIHEPVSVFDNEKVKIYMVKHNWFSRIVNWYAGINGVAKTQADILKADISSAIVVGLPWRIDRFENMIIKQTKLEAASGLYCSTQLTHGSKGSTVWEIIQADKIDKNEVLVIGDSPNDLTMFQIFPHGVAMGNAHPIIKKNAWDVTKSIYKQGVAEAIDKHIFNK